MAKMNRNLNRRIEPTETEMQIALMDWAAYHPILKEYLFHIPNGGSRHIAEAVKLKRMGVKAGVSDLFLAYPNKEKHGLFLECKKKGGYLTHSQGTWIDRMKSVGYDAHVAYGFEDAKNVILDYLSLC